MKLEHSFEVAAPVDQVWATLNDLEQVAPCLPGAAITGHDEDGTYHGTFQVKLGPATASYRGTIRIQEADEAAHTATLAAKGTDKRGQGGASATIVNTLHATDAGGTRVEAVTDFTITGRLASFGRGGMIKDVSNRLLGEFANCLQQRLSATPEPAMTADDAAASAGAEAQPEESAAGERAGGALPAQGASGAMPPPAGGAPPAQAEPVQGLSLLLAVLGDRAKALAPIALQGLRKLAAAVGGLVRSLLARARARRPG
jgi:carbon monoxide dehydrogenase subunit G